MLNSSYCINVEAIIRVTSMEIIEVAEYDLSYCYSAPLHFNFPCLSSHHEDHWESTLDLQLFWLALKRRKMLLLVFFFISFQESIHAKIYLKIQNIQGNTIIWRCYHTTVIYSLYIVTLHFWNYPALFVPFSSFS